MREMDGIWTRMIDMTIPPRIKALQVDFLPPSFFYPILHFTLLESIQTWAEGPEEDQGEAEEDQELRGPEESERGPEDPSGQEAETGPQTLFLLQYYLSFSSHIELGI